MCYVHVHVHVHVHVSARRSGWSTRSLAPRFAPPAFPRSPAFSAPLQVTMFFDKLEGNRTVHTLDLSRNLIGGAHEICAAAAYDGAGLDGRPATGGRAIAEALMVNQTLLTLVRRRRRARSLPATATAARAR